MMGSRNGILALKEGASGMARVLTIARILTVSSVAALIADFMGATLFPTPTAAQAVTPVSPSQASPSAETVTPIGPPASSTVQPVAPHLPGTVTPVTPAQPLSSTTRYPTIKPIAPARMMWLHKDLKLRAQPGLAGKQLAIVRAKSAVPVVGEVVGAVNGYRWYQVDAAGTRGFIAALDLSTQPID